MRFFTPELLERFGSEDDNVALEAQQEFEERSEEYSRQLRELGEKLPQRLRGLLDQFYLHDSRVISHSSFRDIHRHTTRDIPRLSELTHRAKRSAQECRLPSFWILLQLDTPPREILVLQYRSVLIEEARIHQSLRDEDCPNSRVVI